MFTVPVELLRTPNPLLLAPPATLPVTFTVPIELFAMPTLSFAVPPLTVPVTDTVPDELLTTVNPPPPVGLEMLPKIFIVPLEALKTPV